MRNDETENGLIQRRSVIDTATLPPLFPTHRHEGSFWEALGRTVATFGFLEDVEINKAAPNRDKTSLVTDHLL